MRLTLISLLMIPLTVGCGSGDKDTEADRGSNPGSDTGDADPSADQDGDGFSPLDGDCDDTDDTIYPGAEEVWDDDIDQDCDG